MYDLSRLHGVSKLKSYFTLIDINMARLSNDVETIFAQWNRLTRDRLYCEKPGDLLAWIVERHEDVVVEWLVSHGQRCGEDSGCSVNDL